jgi:negative regulator of sigma E activity
MRVLAEAAMDTNKHEANTSNVETTETAKERKPIVDQMTDLAAQAAGALAETAVKVVAKRAKKAAAKRLPAPVKRAAAKTAKSTARKTRAPKKKATAKKVKKSSKRRTIRETGTRRSKKSRRS